METHCVEAHGGGPFLPILPGFSVLLEAAVCVCNLGASPALEHHGWYTAPELSRAVAFSVGRGSFQGLLHKVKTTFMVILRHDSPFSPRISRVWGRVLQRPGDTMTVVTAAHWVDVRISLYFKFSQV